MAQGDLGGAAPARGHLSLFGCWELTSGGRPVTVAANGRRLFALLALNGRRERTYVAGLLWPDHPDRHALGNLRATLARLGRHRSMIRSDPGDGTLALADDVTVDVRDLAETASAVLSRRVLTPIGVLRVLLGDDLLPGWYDDWVLAQREHLRQLRLHALEELSQQLLAAGRHQEAIEAGLAAVATEPLRESAHRVVVRIHLAEGNRAEAIRHYRAFSRLVADELGEPPSALMRELVRPRPLPTAG
jgi:DNA-binding SARP family transcriptional activator